MPETINLETLSIDELRDLRKKVERAITSFQDRKRREAQAAAAEIARQHGFSLNELTGQKTTRGRQASSETSAAPRYANPDNASQTWSGRGRRPAWIAAQLEAGRTLEDMAI